MFIRIFFLRKNERMFSIFFANNFFFRRGLYRREPKLSQKGKNWFWWFKYDQILFNPNISPTHKNLPRFDRFPISHHCFNGLNLLNWALSIPFANILSEYFWNAKICISALIARFCGGWQFFWRWQINTGWNSCKKTRTIRTLINYTAATLFQIIYGIPK